MTIQKRKNNYQPKSTKCISFICTTKNMKIELLIGNQKMLSVPDCIFLSLYFKRFVNKCHQRSFTIYLL